MTNKVPAVLMCYGCSFYNASAVGERCSHPNNIFIQWDQIRGYSYRYPSVEQCILAGGKCSMECFAPDKKNSIICWVKGE